MIYFKEIWYEHLPLVELSYNNSYHSSIAMAPFEVFYGRRTRSPIGWFEVGDSSILGPNLIYKSMEKVYFIRNLFQIAHSQQKSYADYRRKELVIEEGDKVYLKVSSMKGVVIF